MRFVNATIIDNTGAAPIENDILDVTPNSRIGFVVARFGQSAVRRNRLKRILREHARRHLLGTLRAMKPGETVDVVLRTGPDAYGASAAALESDIAKLNARISTLFTERDLPQGELPGRARPSDP